MNRLLTFTAFALLLASCVPNKKIAYLQYKDELNRPQQIKIDSLVRKYETGTTDYRLRRGDLLDIKISTLTPIAFNPFADADRNLIPGQQTFQTYDITRQVQTTGYYVEDDGAVNIPILGKITVEGLSLSQAEDTLEVHVKKYLEKPVVRIKLQNFRFTVLGEVQNDATLTSGDNQMTLLQAIGMAGGVSEFGDLSRVKVIRHSGDETYVFYVNLLNEDFLQSPFYCVQPDDIIVVAPLKPRAWLKYASPNLSILTSGVSLLVALISLLR